ncbi:DEAD/DEAH box helicase [Ferrimonas sediminicola]|uniref:DEAD/DEAH box helicase n=1 Tax=Ferrimonas sediminicola TaxID=2569538 RepID=A0A4U1BAV6_9GAMM|nr:DEAD/DEAH box helicase [Ferrimonas sediminicola]TKB47988.1 DEAD/DEAH box helicase [Ferrimonas sediminicola]
MLPTVVSQQINQSLRHFLSAQFPMTTPCFSGQSPSASAEEAASTDSMMQRFLQTPESLLKGPYLSVQLPFRGGALPVGLLQKLSLPFPPHAHQVKAFERLLAPQPLSSLVATGTGSGKTECFAYPVLEHCARKAPSRGIKAIVIYPMNALAQDQAKRFAKLVHGSTALNGKVTVGLYVGEDQHGQGNPTMSEDKVITCRDTLRKQPPDVLLTNYKMLDYLLLRPEDQALWRDNGPETLRYLVVDELHTFDGAQGADLGCLLRRLRDRLQIPAAHLACVGTSATVGDEPEALLNYASQIFDNLFEAGAIIAEDRLDVGEYLQEYETNYRFQPDQEHIAELQPRTDESRLDFVNRQIVLWFDGSLAPLPSLEPEEAGEALHQFGQSLCKHRFFHTLLRLLDGQIQEQSTLNQLLMPVLSVPAPMAEAMVHSFVALISAARGEQQSNGEWKPLLEVRVQSWLRELRRMVASIASQPELYFADDLGGDLETRHLPVVHCRDCGATAWGSYLDASKGELSESLSAFYQHFFQNHHSVRLLFPVLDKTDPRQLGKGVCHQLCGHCLAMNGDNANECQHCGNEQLLRVFVPDLISTSQTSGNSFKNQCPSCLAKDSLLILGSRAASLASVMTHQWFGSRYNENKQLLTFSDSVQDAAHRAGFLEARTWPMMIRAGIGAGCGALVADGATEVTLAEYADRFVEQMRQQSGDERTFVLRNIAPNLTWLRGYQQLLEGTFQPEHHKGVLGRVERRLAWEVYSEFGLRSGIGRTLERSGLLVPALLSDGFYKAVELAHVRLTEELGQPYQQVTQPQLQQFALVLLHRLRQRGGIFHWAMKDYFADNGDLYRFNKRSESSRYMPQWGPNSRKPRFIGIGRADQIEPVLSTKGRSWWAQWLDKCLAQDDPTLSACAADLIQTLIQCLEQQKVLVPLQKADKQAWCIAADKITLQSKVAAMVCNTCGQRHFVARSESELWREAPCRQTNCQGHYQDDNREIEPYWLGTESYRVVAREHTGLIGKTERDQLEKSFKAAQHESGQVNLLSATPTLEMGIDIGDLSSVLLCSVPPAQANYLQRIGRAGRRDGNAFAFTVAQGNPHDQYFFAEPLTMMQGHVEVPGVFLDAPAILARQLTAFMFDRWVAADDRSGQISKNVGQMLVNLAKDRKDKFPFNFLSYADRHRDALLRRFFSVFPDLSEASRESLRAFAEGDDENYSLSGRIIDALQWQLNDKESLTKRISVLKKAHKELEGRNAVAQTHEKDLNTLLSEMTGLQKILGNLKNQNVFNFFTDQGLLPNYAFPEAGVNLRSVLWRQISGDDENKRQYETETFDYERPAAAALSELAPTSNFYAGGHKVQVEQVDLHVTEPEEWRLCRNCNFTAREDEAKEFKTCPSCGDSNWADVLQHNKLLPLRQVYARSAMRDAKIGDDSENRVPSFFQRQMLVHFEKSAVEAAYRIDDEHVPFGYEYIRTATFRDINFGANDPEAEEFKIAGDDRKRTGFKVCAHCGMVQPPIRKKQNHDLSCPSLKDNVEEKYENVLFLYRELQSEALRVLLPVSGLSDDKLLKASLAAALQLGLRKYFRGNVDHLRGLIYQQPEPNDPLHRNYLVIYDTVPGGTGSLKELMREPDNLMTMLQMALDAIEECNCNQDPEKDGCYRCVYAYRDRGKMAHISRDVARQLLNGVLQSRHTLMPVDNIGKICINSLVTSELEKKFIQCLHGMTDKFRLKKSIVHGKGGWVLSVREDSDLYWHIVPQVELGPVDGVTVMSKPDFVIYPGRQDMAVKPIAVFLDGYAYHKDIVADDIAKRRAIAASGKYWVWSLYWPDLEKPGFEHGDGFLDRHIQDWSLRDGISVYSLALRRNFKTITKLHNEFNSFELLTQLLQSPEQRLNDFTEIMLAHGIKWLRDPRKISEDTKRDFSYEMQENASESRLQQLFSTDRYLFGGLLNCLGTTSEWVEVASVLPVKQDTIPLMRPGKHSQELTSAALQNLMLQLCFDDTKDPSMLQDGRYQSLLIGFWKLVNLGQCLPGFGMTCRSIVHDGDEADISHHDQPQEEPAVAISAEWQELLDLELMPEALLKQLVEAGLEAPISGYELADGHGEIVATADWAWEAAKVVVFEQSDPDGEQKFREQGWQEFVGMDEATQLTAVIEAVQGAM